MALEISVGVGRPRTSETIVGIDLGTTNSLVAWVDAGTPRILKTRDGRALLPSVISTADGATAIGDRAKARRARDASQTVSSVKRLLGRKWEDLRELESQLPYRLVHDSEGEVRVQMGDLTYSAVEISAMILRELKQTAETELGRKVTKAVVTVPAYFNDSQRQATRAAGRIAGLDVLRIINEPTAAALAYGLDRKKQGLIAVYDLGGGTFDISILKLKDGIFEVLATHGDTALGGDDLDRAMAAHFGAELAREWGVDLAQDIELRATVLEAAERAKIALSQSDTAELSVESQGRTWTRPVTQAQFESLVAGLVERTRGPCERALADAGLSADQLSDVILVGGPTRLPIVQKTAQAIFGRAPNTSVHPDEVVAIGAAIQADILAGNNRELLLLDVVPLSLGIETYGGIMSPIIARNSRIPAVARENFTTFVDNQTGVDIHVLQGERDRIEDNRSLARFKLKGIEPAPAGMARIEVNFLVDADGILNVSARDLKTGREQSIEVRPTFGISDADVERMLEASMQNAEQDVAFRQWVDARNDAEPILRGAERNLEAAQRLLSPDDAREVAASIEGLRTALAGQDPAKLPEVRQANLRLKMATKHLAELLIKEKISGSSR